jgi:hypothetical protein
MKLLISLTLTWVFGFSLPLLAQDKLHGRVTDAETSRPLEAVMISVMRDGMTIDYALTDANGCYSLPWHHEGTLQVSASLLGYGRQTCDVSAGRQLNFTLQTESIVLKEVEIRPGRISSRRDTIRYNLADFATAKDTHIKDVLKRLPGIDVKENGTVTYKGKPIDHFLVEGMDVTGGRYNQVNNNLDARAVKSAELMENYQSVRALSGKLDSEEVALNLKLDEQARDQWFPTLEGGGGLTEEASGRTTALWQGSLSALQLGRGRQSIFSLKTNNTGHDLSNEQAQLATSRQSNITLPSLLTQSSISTPLDTRRLLFNETYTANANRMSRRSDERSLRLQADYTHNRVQQQRGNVQTFYQAGDTVQLEEAANYRLVTDALHANLAYEDNATTHYLTNRLTLEAERDRGHAGELEQTIETARLKAHNHLDYLKNRDEHTWELTSDVQLDYQPSTLSLPSEQDEYAQHSLYTHHAASYLHKRNGLTSHLKADVTAEWSRYRLEQPGGTASYNASQLSARLSPQLQWDRGSVFAFIKVPVSWNHYFGARQSYFLYSPGVYLRYQHDYHWKFSAYGSFSRSAGNALDICPYLRRTDYRTLTSTNGLMPLSNALTGQLYAEYKNTVQEFFATATLNYSHGRHSTLYEQYISADTVATLRRSFRNTTDTWTLTTSLSKGIFDWRLKASLDLQLTRHYGQQLTRTSSTSPALLQDFRYDYLQAEPKIVWSPVNWLEATYHATVGYSSTRIDNDTELTPLLNVVQRLRLNFSIGKVDLAVSGEHYKNDLGNGNRTNTLLADVSATWRHDRWRIETCLSNLFNKKNYAYTTYTATQSRTDWLRIRPREILASISYSF